MECLRSGEGSSDNLTNGAARGANRLGRSPDGRPESGSRRGQRRYFGASRGATFTGLSRLISVPSVVTVYFAIMFGRSQAGSVVRSRR